MASFLNLISSIGTAVAGFFNWKNSTVAQRRAAEEDLQKKEAEKASLKAEISTAIHTGDDAKLNEILTRLMPLVFLAFAFVFLAGCMTPKTVVKYVPTDRRIESCTNSIGIACKAVPNAVFEELVHAQIELTELRREMTIDKRLSK